MQTVCLVSCASKKRDGQHRACDLYVSDLFSKSARYAQENSEQWYILSAKYGLLKPDALIEEYDVTLNRMSSPARRRWAEQVFQALRMVLAPSDCVILLAGQRYVEFLAPMLRACGVEVRRPLEGLRIGEQLGWLKRQIK